MSLRRSDKPTDAFRLALEGGEPVRRGLLPYAHQSVDEDDVDSVAAALRSDWLTGGPRVREFEEAVAARCGAGYGVAVSSGTAALHAAVSALHIGPGDRVIVPALTFAATANCVVYQGATPVFADVSSDTGLMDPASVTALLTDSTRAVIAVDYCGQPCEYDTLRLLARDHGFALVADASHALGGALGSDPVGTLADLTTLSFHPVKHIATGEGGMVVTDDEDLANKARRFRNHGLDRDQKQRAAAGTWRYDLSVLGFNYRLSEIHAALGLSQLGKLDRWILRRRAIADRYEDALASIGGFSCLSTRPRAYHARHLFVVLLDPQGWSTDRDTVFLALRAEGIGVNVHYWPVHLLSFYREHFDTRRGMCPVTEDLGARLLTLPLYPDMSDVDVDDVLKALLKVSRRYWGS